MISLLKTFLLRSKKKHKGLLLLSAFLILAGWLGAASSFAEEYDHDEQEEVAVEERVVTYGSDSAEAIKRETQRLYNQHELPNSVGGVGADAGAASVVSSSRMRDDSLIRDKVYKLYMERQARNAQKALVAPAFCSSPQECAETSLKKVDVPVSAEAASSVPARAAEVERSVKAADLQSKSAISFGQKAAEVVPEKALPKTKPQAPSISDNVLTLPSKPDFADAAATPVLSPAQPAEEKAPTLSGFSSDDFGKSAFETSYADQDVLSDEMAFAYFKKITGDEGMPLNISEASAHADIQAPVHLDEAVAFALRNNFEISAAQEKTAVAYWEKMGAYSQFIPSVQVSMDTGPERSQPASINDSYGNRVVDNVHHRRDRSITVNQPLIDLSLIADILSATDKEDVAKIDRRDVREGVAFDTISAYLSLMQARIAIQLADDYKRYLEKLVVRMKARVEGGGAPSADLDRIRGRVAIAEGARIEAVGEYEARLAELRRITKITPPEIVIPATLAPVLPAKTQEAMEMALRSNPSYLASIKKTELADDDRNKAFSSFLPKLSFQYSNSYSYNAGGAAGGNPVDGVYPTQKTQNVMLVAQWNLSAPSAVSGVASIAKEREMNFRSLDIRSRLEEGIKAGYSSINAARARQLALKKTIDADERVVKGFEDQFENGARSLFDLLDSYEQLYNARLNFIRVTIAGAKAAYQVHRQIGELIPTVAKMRGK